MRDVERGRDTGRGRSRLHPGSPMQDSIPGLQGHALGCRRRQTAAPPGLPVFSLSWCCLLKYNFLNFFDKFQCIYFSCGQLCSWCNIKESTADSKIMKTSLCFIQVILVIIFNTDSFWVTSLCRRGRREPTSIFCMWIPSCPSAICGKHYPSPIELSQHSLLKSDSPQLWRFISGLSNPFQWLITATLVPNDTILIAAALQLSLEIRRYETL